MDVTQIVEAWLKANGYDGLYLQGCCACEVGDIAPCGEITGECSAGYKVSCPGQDDCEHGGCGSWHMSYKKGGK